MFREMRRKRQLLSQEDIQKVLYQGTSGVLAVSGDAAYPYAVPLSYVYDGEKIYFHSAKSGHKIDAVSQNPRASFCVIDQDQIVPEEYTTYFRSVIVFGTIRILHDEAEKREAIEKIIAITLEKGEFDKEKFIYKTIYNIFNRLYKNILTFIKIFLILYFYIFIITK